MDEVDVTMAQQEAYENAAARNREAKRAEQERLAQAIEKGEDPRRVYAVCVRCEIDQPEARKHERHCVDCESDLALLRKQGRR